MSNLKGKLLLDEDDVSLNSQDSRALLNSDEKNINSPFLEFSNIKKHPMWNIAWLAMAWALTLTTSTLLNSIGPLSAKRLNCSDQAATFTVGTFLFGAAFSSVPSGWLFRKLGRFAGFSVGCLCQVVGGVIGYFAMTLEWPSFLFTGCFLVGLGQGLGQFYRFSAIELSPDNFKANAVTYVLTGGVLAAYLGPLVADNSIDLFKQEYVGSFMFMSVIGITNWLILFLVNFPKVNKKVDDKDNDIDNDTDEVNLIGWKPGKKPISQTVVRTTSEIVKQPAFIIACMVATLAHTIMIMLMSCVTLSMTYYGYDFTQCSLVMTLHFMGMFGPGFISGSFILTSGPLVVSLFGGVLLVGSVVSFSIGTEMWNFITGMILCGIGWNFSFSSGTVMLTRCYLPHEATSVQAINDAILFSVAGTGSLISGAIFAYYGWQTLIYVTSTLIVANLVLFFLAWGFRSTMEEDIKEEIPISGSNGSDQSRTKTRYPQFSHSVDQFIRKLSIADEYSDLSGQSGEVEYVRSISVA
jgi:predicted MFS family arabinose efflux permease